MSTPTADIRLNVAANSAAAQYAMMEAKMRRFMRSMQSETDRTGRKASQAGSKFKSWAVGIGKATAGLFAMGALLKGAETSFSLIADRMQTMVDLSNMSKERQVSYEDRLKSFFFQSIPASVKDPEAFTAQIDSMVKDSPVRDKSALLDIMQTTMSTMGNVDPMVRAKFGRDIGESRRDMLKGDQLEALKAFAGVASMAQLNYADQGSTAMSQLGLMQKAITSSAVADMTSFSRNIAPIGNKVKLMGGNQIEGLGLGAATSTLFNDQTGQLVETAVMNMLGKLSMAEERFGIDKTGKSLLERQEFIRGFDPKAVEARKSILASFASDASELTDDDRAMMSAAEMNKALAPKLGGRAKTLFGAMQFFQPQYDIGADQTQSLNDQLSRIEQKFNIDSTGKQLVERIQFMQSTDPVATQARQGLSGSFEGDAKKYLAWMSSDGPGSLNDLFKGAISEIGGQYSRPGVIDQRGTYEKLDSTMREMIDTANSSTLFANSTREMKTAEATETSLMGKENLVHGETATPDSDYDTFMKSTGQTAWARWARQQDAKWTGGSETLEQSLERQKRDLQKRQFRLATEGRTTEERQKIDEFVRNDPRGLMNSGALKSVGLNDSEASSVLALNNKIDSVVQELQAIRLQGEKPRKVESQKEDKKPEPPAAAQIGK